MNLSPSLAFDSPLDLKIKGNLLTDAFNLVGIPKLCAQPPKTEETKKYQQDEIAQILQSANFGRDEIGDYLSNFA